MSSLAADPLDLPRVQLGEGCTWHDGAFWYCDVSAGRLIRFDPASGESETFETGGPVLACIAPAEGGFIGGVECGFAMVRIDGESARREVVADVVPMAPGARMNDGTTDRQGRFWAGSIEPDRPGLGRLFVLDRDGAREVFDGFRTQNGVAFSPDGRTMYMSDSNPAVAKVWALDLDPDLGLPTRRRVFADFADLGGRPDGAAMDTDGCYWIAATDSGRILRLTPDGALDMVLQVPTANPTNIAFGGADMRTAFITSLVKGEAADDNAGRCFIARMPVAGVPDVPFPGPDQVPTSEISA